MTSSAIRLHREERAQVFRQRASLELGRVVLQQLGGVPADDLERERVLEDERTIEQLMRRAAQGDA